MRSSTMTKRLLALALVLSILASWAMPVRAEGSGVHFHKVDNDSVSADPFDKDSVEAPEKEPEYQPMDTVRVSIFLDKKGTIEAGFAVDGIAKDQAAVAYRAGLEKDQEALVQKIESVTDEDLDVVANLTLATNLISANVKFGQIKTIEKIKGVRNVVIETAYAPAVASKDAANPNMATSGVQIGSSAAYASGYTGAGSRIAVIDTGVDYEHLSFNSAAYEYSLSMLAQKAGMSVEAYVESLNLLDAAEVTSVWDQLHISALEGLTAEHLYFGSKIPFGFNYVDVNINISHAYDQQGEHGSHVAGIATANAYVPNADGSFDAALEAVYAQGVAPDAQLIVMKVFGANGGAYPSDYMLAIEDAIVLGADVINMSLGSAAPGMSSDTEPEYQAIFDSLEKSGVVVSISAGNAGSWVDVSENQVPYLYLDDVSMHTSGSPGSYTNSLGVASVDNAGFTGLFISVDGVNFSYYDSNGGTYTNKPLTTIAGEQEFVFIDGIGTPEDWAAVGDALVGKVAICSRGETSFFEKAKAAVEAGAIATIIYNNSPAGLFGMDLTDYPYEQPCVSMSMEDALVIRSLATPVMDGETVLYYTGTMNISGSVSTGYYSSPFYTMSSFSSWGVPGSLELKPEITAPGGSIHSVAGMWQDGSQYYFDDHASYEVMSGTSMAAPQVAGMVALIAQYIREEGLEAKTGLDARTLAQSLLMSTAEPIVDGNSGVYYPVIQQGAGLANVGSALMADSYILMGADATASHADGKVKVELGDDPSKTGVYTFTFTINNLTGEEKTYALSADFFTQGAFAYNFGYGNALYMDSWMTQLAPVVTWKVNGKAVEGGSNMAGMDFNGDGYVNSYDGQALLDYAVGNLTELSNAAKADLNADEAVNSYDAYLFFEMLGISGAVVPANGSATVEVTVSLSEDDKAWLAYYENGAYLEGYVYAESLTSDEGVEGTCHSIPVLGYYGNWSDPSMFDNVSYTDYVHGTYTQMPYVAQTGTLHGLVVEGNFFGGNPFVTDAVYMPERNAISGLNNDVLDELAFTAIRNAGESLFYLTGNGEYLLAETLGPVSSAFYYTNGGYWENTYYTLDVGIDAQTLYSIMGDVTYEIGLTLVPEYYVDAEGNVAWDALGEGTTFSVPFTVDMAAPELLDVSISVMNNTLNLEAKDNKYIAAVALFDEFGSYCYGGTVQGSHADAEAGATVEYALDLTGVHGAAFLLQIFDYAGNVTTYAIEQQIGEVTDTIEGIVVEPESLMLQKGTTAAVNAVVYPINASDRSFIWNSSDETVATVDENGTVVAVGEGTAVITATSVMDSTKSAACALEVIDIAVDMNGIVWDENGSIWFSQFNTANLPNYTKLSGDMLALDYLASACTGPDGTIYASSVNTNSLTGNFYTVNPETYEATLLGNCSGYCYTDLAYAPNMYGTGADALLATYGPYLLSVDPATGNLIEVLDKYDSYLVGVTVCYGVYDADSGMSNVAVYLMQNDGTLYQEVYCYLADYGYSLPYYYYMYEQRMSLDTGVDKSGAMYFNSLHYDAANAMLFWSAFDVKADNNVTLYAIDEMKDFCVYNLGQFADGVWPVGGLHQNVAVSGANQANVDSAAVAALAKEKGKETLRVEPIAPKSFYNNYEFDVRPMSSVTVGEDEKNVFVQITAGELAEAAKHTNGVSVVTYDAAALELQSVVVHADHSAQKLEEGKIIFGYVDLDGFAADAVVATAVFKAKATEDQKVNVTYQEINDKAPGSNEDLVVTYPHANTELRNEKTPTCTEDGYTGDVYCTDCGKQLAAGKSIPATGHTMGDWKETKAPTCTEKGEQTKYCADCDHTETRDIEMLAHTMGQWKPADQAGKHQRQCACGEKEVADCVYGSPVVTKMPTVEAEGQKTYTCTICGATKTEVMAKLEPTNEVTSKDEDAKLNVSEDSTATVDKNTVLVVETVEKKDEETLKETLKKEDILGSNENQLVHAYDVSLLLDDVQVQPGGDVQITVPVPVDVKLFGTFTVVLVSYEGKVTTCEATVNADNTITFTTSAMGTVALLATPTQEAPPATGDHSMISVCLALLAVSAVSALVVIRKKETF